MSRPLLVVIMLLGVLVSSSCAQRRGPVRDAVLGSTHVAQQGGTPHPEVSVPRVVYVADFRLDTQAQEAGSDRPRLLELPGQSRDPAEQAAAIVDLTARSLIDDLNRAGVPARRLVSGTPLPASGWLVRGVFTEAAEGSAVRRTVVGFGAGAPRMEVQVAVSDLADQPDAPFVILGTATDPDRLPSGLLSRNPYIVGAKFVLEKGAPEREVKSVAQAIADRIVELRARVADRQGSANRRRKREGGLSLSRAARVRGEPRRRRRARGGRR